MVQITKLSLFAKTRGLSSMRKMKNIVRMSAITSVMIAAACSGNHGGSDRSDVLESYNLDREVDAVPGDVFSGVELVPLEFDGRSYPKSIADLRVEDGRIFIQDNSRLLHIFSETGESFGSTEQVRGQGPGEFTILNGFSWNPYSQSVQILTPWELLAYDDHFSELRSRCKLPSKLGQNPFTFGRIYDLSPDEHLLLPTFADDRFTVYRFNSRTEDFALQFSYSDDVLVPETMQDISFTPLSSGRLCFSPQAFTGSLYCMNSDDLSVEGVIRIIPTSDYLPDGKPEINSNVPSTIDPDKKTILNQLINSDYIVLLSTIGMYVKDWSHIFISRDSTAIRSIPLSRDDLPQLPFIYYIDDDYAYGCLEIDEIRENPQLLNAVGEFDMALLDSIEPESLVLMKYKF